MPDAIIEQAHTALEKAAGYLLAQQCEDGTWRDYFMEPGESHGWTTAVVGLALGKPPVFPKTCAALEKAAKAVIRLGTAKGWGYNPNTHCDADSTAWCVCFLSSMGYNIWPEALERLFTAFLSPEGQFMTYTDTGVFGLWAGPHQDVIPLVGMAVRGKLNSLYDSVCRAVLSGFSEEVPWRSFWWTTDSYAIARSLELLSAAGLITGEIVKGVVCWLSKLEPPENAFEAAQRLSIAVGLLPFHEIYPGHRAVLNLLERQKTDGSWPGSPTLLPAPPRSPEDTGSPPIPLADRNCLMTTASAVYAIKQWMEKVERC